MNTLVSKIKTISQAYDESNKLDSEFKTEFKFEHRQREANQVLERYPDRVPVIIERSKNCTNINIIDKRKYLVPIDITMSQFLWIIRRRLYLNESTALFLFNQCGTVFQNTQLISNIYEESKDEDGFLYLQYASENTFG